MVALAKNPDRFKLPDICAPFTRKTPRSKQINAPNPLQPHQRARYYDPTTGEFVSRDPLEYQNEFSMYTSRLMTSDFNSRKVCCAVQIGIVIKENFGKTIDCPSGKSAHECCSQTDKFGGWGQPDYRGWGAEGRCEKYKRCGVSALVAPVTTTVEKGKKCGKANPVVGTVVVIFLIAECIERSKEGSPPKPPKDGNDNDWDKCYEECRRLDDLCLNSSHQTLDFGTRCNTCENYCRARCRLKPRPIPVWGEEMFGVDCKFWRGPRP